MPSDFAFPSSQRENVFLQPLNPGLAIRLALTNGTSQCAQRFQKSLHMGLLSLAVVATPDHCVNKLKPACWNGNREENKGAPHRHVRDTTLGQATPFEPLHDLLCMVNSGKTRKLPSRAQCKLLNHTQKTVIVSIPLNSGLLCYTVINTYMLEGGSESCSQSHKKSSVGVGFQARAASSTACLLASTDSASLKCPTGAPTRLIFFPCMTFYFSSLSLNIIL